MEMRQDFKEDQTLKTEKLTPGVEKTKKYLTGIKPWLP